MKNVESPFMQNQWDREKNARAARTAERVAWLAYGMSVGLLLGFALFQLARMPD